MKTQVKIKNKVSQEYTHGAIFDSEQEAQEWVNSQLQKQVCPWGKPEHSIEVLDENQERFDPPQYETIPSEFEIEIVDISAQVEQERINREAQEFLDESDWKVLRHRDQVDLGLATSLSNEEFQSLLVDRQSARDSIIK